VNAANEEFGAGCEAPGTRSVTEEMESNQRAPKKLIIRPLRREPKLPQEFYQESWTHLARALDQVFSPSSRRPLSYEEHYRRVEDLCLHHLAKQLYADLQREVDGYLERVFREQLSDPVLAAMLHVAQGSAQAVEPTERPAFAPVLDVWRAFCERFRDIQAIFLYLDRTYAAESPQVPSLWEMALELFAKHMLAEQQRVLLPTLGAVLLEIELDRKGKQRGDCSDLRAILREMFAPLGFYRTHFEPLFFQQTRAFYVAKGTEFVTQGTLSDYLAYFEHSTQAEAERCRLHLEPSTEKPLFAILHDVLGRHCVSVMMDRGLESLLDAVSLTDLRRLYVLLRSIDELWRLVPRYSDYIRVRGTQIVNDRARDHEMIERLLALLDRAEQTEREAFQADVRFHNAAQTAFEAALNTRQPTPAERLARSFHDLLRVSSTSIPEPDIRRKIGKLLELFRYLSGKDSFLAFYKKYLAQRLLFDLTASTACEQYVVELLRAECGAVYVNHLVNMLKDMDLSQDLLQEYRMGPGSGSSRLPSFTCKVITQAYWNSSESFLLQVPPGLESQQRSFHRFYHARFSGRRLIWEPSLSSAELRVQFANGEKVLHVTLSQAVVLLLFNERDAWTLAELQQQTGIADSAELERILDSLSSSQCPVLIRERGAEAASSGPVTAPARYRFNADLQTSRRRLRLLDIALLERQPEQVPSAPVASPDRQHQIDAAIVRLLKKQKSLSHADLVQQLGAELCFGPSVSDVKQRVESLLQREYIGRDERDPNLYHYVS
jgi:cullin-4